MAIVVGVDIAKHTFDIATLQSNGPVGARQLPPGGSQGGLVRIRLRFYKQ